MRPVRAALLTVSTGLLLAAFVEAQIPSPTGNVFGVARDEQSTPIPGATATLVGPDALRKTTTDVQGAFRFLGIAPGNYDLEIAHDGFDVAKHQVVVQVGKNAVLEIALQVAVAREAVDVVAEPPSLDRRKVETGATFDRTTLREIPTTRDVWSVLRQIPGVLLSNVDVGNGHGAIQPAFVGKGAREDQNTYNVDGVSISVGGFLPLYLDFDSLESIGVTTGGSDPSISVPGVTVNVVTKRGTNRVAGSARALYTDGSQWDYGVEAGGPLWKEHAWIWAAGASNSYLGQEFVLQSPTHETVISQDASKYWNGKLAAQIVPSNTLTLGFIAHARDVEGRGAGPDRSQPSTQDVRWPVRSYRVEDSHVVTEKLFLSVNFSYSPAGREAVPHGLDSQAYLDPDYVWRNSYTLEVRSRDVHQAGVTASRFFETGELQHEAKLGLGYRHARLKHHLNWPDDQLVGRSPDSTAMITREANTDITDDFYDAYLADTVQAGSLTVNAGLRFDYQRSGTLPSAVAANPVFPELLPAARYEPRSGSAMVWRSAQPRIGATYTIGTDRGTVIRASYARFADELGDQASQLDAFPGIAALYYAWNDGNRNGRVEPAEIDLGTFLFSQNVDPGNPGSGLPVNRIASDLAAPKTDEFIVGIERQISPHLSVSLAYTHRVLRGPLFTPLIGKTTADYAYVANAAGTVSDPNTGFVLAFSEPYYRLTTALPAGTILQNRADTTETYDGIELQGIKTFSNGWMVRASFAYNNWRQRIGAAGIVDPNNEVPGTNASGPVVDGTINAKWQFNVAAAVRLPLNIFAGVNVFGRQGFPIPYYVNVITDYLFPSIQIGSATDYRTPTVFQVDLELSRTFAVASRVQITPVLACFNLFNKRTVLGRDGRVGDFDESVSPDPAFMPNDSFNAFTEKVGIRTVRGGVRVSF